MIDDKYLASLVCLVGRAGKMDVEFAWPYPYFRMRFGPYGWWGPWWGWN